MALSSRLPVWAGPVLAAPVWAGPVCLTVLTVAAITAWAWAATGGESPYPLDDTFIHLAMAKNAAHGHWGVSAHAFSNASSSPLYVGLLGLLGKAGLPWLWIPLGVNIAAAAALLILLAGVMKREAIADRAALAYLFAVVVLLPLPYIVMFGMEHTLHTAAVVAFVGAAVRCLQGGSARWLMILAPPLLLLRLESALLVALVSICLLRSRRYRDGTLLPLLAAIPLIALGLFSKANGEHLLPNPILLKAGLPATELWLIPLLYFSKAAFQLIETPALLFLLATLLYAADRALKSTENWRDSKVLWPMAALLSIGGHAAFANIGWLYRYEMYLVALALAALAISMPKPKIWVILLAALPCAYRAYDCATLLPGAILELNAQQVQMAHLIREHYNDSGLALHDIGSVAFYTDARMLDLAGLASRDVLRQRLSGRFSTQDLDRMAIDHDTGIAIVYDSWFQGTGDVRHFWNGPKIPASWVKIGEWRFRKKTRIAGQALSFYATAPLHRDKLRRALQSFVPRLSASVQLHLTNESVASIGVPGKSAE